MTEQPIQPTARFPRPWPAAHTALFAVRNSDRLCLDCKWVDITRMEDAERMFLLDLRCPAHYEADPWRDR